ncbi:MAG: transcription antitermination factor NusB [Clostridiales bacterium]|nr:transcription antitermination factor NusB [Clostridiales bacterium]
MSLNSNNVKKRLDMRERREVVFVLLFQMLVANESLQEVLETCTEEFELISDKKAIKKVEDIAVKADFLDEEIAKFSPKRAFSRIAKTNVIILRIAFFEILFDESTPYKVSINEAVELAKKYGDNSDKAFINGVLDSFVKSLQTREAVKTENE